MPKFHPARAGLLALAAYSILLPAAAALAQGAAPLRMCADPGNMPLSNSKGEGFQNKIAQVIAEAMGTQATFFYRPYLERGLTRQTFDNNECDLLMDMSPDDERMILTKPLYRSTFVLAYRSDRGIDVSNLDDPRLLNDLKVGVFQHSALRTVLQEHGIKRENTFVHTISHDADLRPERQPHYQVQQVLDGTLDVAAVWGPLAGWYRTIKGAPLTILPLNRLEDRTPLEFSLAIGLPRSARALKPRIEQALLDSKDKIRKVLDDFGVPLVQCSDCVISGDIPSHGPYAPRPRQASNQELPPQSDPATLPALISEALKGGSTLGQELHNATIARDATRIEYLLKHRAKVDSRDVEGLTPLMVAVKTGDFSIVNGLLDYGADPNAQDRDGWTAAMHAVRQNEAKLIRLLARHKARFEVVNRDGITALGLAVNDNRVNTAVALLDTGAKADTPLGAARYTALMLAARQGNLPLSQTLLQYGANVNARNAGGVTALMVAAARNQDLVVSLLLKAGADAGLKDAEGETALTLARRNEAGKALERLEPAARAPG